MDIQWHGLSCVSFKGKDATVVVDPYETSFAGIKMPKIDADVILANGGSETMHAVSGFGKETRVFDWPGEYEAKNVIVQAITAHDRPREKDERKDDDAKEILMYAMNMDGFRVCHLSTLGHKLTPEMIEAIGEVDILLLPIGDLNCLDAGKAHMVLEQLEPRVVIPMYYKTEGVKLSLAPLEPFLKEVGLHDVQKVKALKLTSPSVLPQDRTEFHILEATSA